MIGDRELLALRAEYCSLLSRLFLSEADAELMRVLADGARERGRGASAMHPLIAEGWFQLGGLCARGDANEWAERCAGEYVTLFVGPGIPRLTPCESHYLSGRAYGAHLSLVRQFMGRVGLDPMENTQEPEDHISFEMQILRHLIEKQGSSIEPDDEAGWLSLQGEFVRRHLGRWALQFFRDIAGEKEAEFFAAYAKIGAGYVAWEQTLLEGWGPAGDGEDLLQIQMDRPWKGPLFDPAVPNPERIEEPFKAEEESS